MNCRKKPYKKIKSAIICSNCGRICELAGGTRKRKKYERTPKQGQIND